jgi:hypothetical protein
MSGVITGVIIGAGLTAMGFAAAFFLGAAFFLAGFFLAAAFFLGAAFFLAAGFFFAATFFLAAGFFFAAGFFLAAGFLAAGFFAAGFFLAAGFLAAGFFAAGFFAAGFFAAGFLAAAMIKLLSMVGPNCLYIALRWIAALPRIHSVERLSLDNCANWIQMQSNLTQPESHLAHVTQIETREPTATRALGEADSITEVF